MAKAKKAVKKAPTAVVPVPVPVEAPKEPEVNARCRRASDPVFSGSSCAGMRAFRRTPLGHHVVTLCCTTCQYTWTTPLGGTFQGM